VTARPSRGYVVTGGTGALGSAVVAHLLGEGHRVVVPYRDEEGWRALRPEAHAGTLWGRKVHLVDFEDTRSFVDEAARNLGSIDGVAAVAGAFAMSGNLETAPASEWGTMMDTNLTTVYNVCRAALPHLVKARGSVVTVGSRSAETGGAGAAAYAVSKVAVSALTRVLALENRDRGVRFNCIAPGFIDTPQNRASMPKADTSKWTSPKSIAAVIAFLLSDASAPTTGALIPVDAPG
jgi:NAD(P)-dependent dehydrogenase (short-subunit alcohol dehydrogenase family)